jgi:hypothetical protein
MALRGSWPKAPREAFLPSSGPGGYLSPTAGPLRVASTPYAGVALVLGVPAIVAGLHRICHRVLRQQTPPSRSTGANAPLRLVSHVSWLSPPRLQEPRSVATPTSLLRSAKPRRQHHRLVLDYFVYSALITVCCAGTPAVLHHNRRGGLLCWSFEMIWLGPST